MLPTSICDRLRGHFLHPISLLVLAAISDGLLNQKARQLVCKAGQQLCLCLLFLLLHYQARLEGTSRQSALQACHDKSPLTSSASSGLISRPMLSPQLPASPISVICMAGQAAGCMTGQEGCGGMGGAMPNRDTLANTMTNARPHTAKHSDTTVQRPKPLRDTLASDADASAWKQQFGKAQVHDL